MGAGRKQYRVRSQRGVSLTGIIFLLAIFAALFIVGMRMVPAFVEYKSVKNAIVRAKAAGGSPREMRLSFDKDAGVNDINAVKGKDLDITRGTEGTEISFEYEKRIPLVANATLLLKFSGTTDPSGQAPAKREEAQQ